jgi:hypothetical protein
MTEMSWYLIVFIIGVIFLWNLIVRSSPRYRGGWHDASKKRKWAFYISLITGLALPIVFLETLESRFLFQSPVYIFVILCAVESVFSTIVIMELCATLHPRIAAWLSDKYLKGFLILWCVLMGLETFMVLTLRGKLMQHY